MDGKGRISPASSGSGAWPATGQPDAARPGGRPPPGGAVSGQGHPDLPRRMSRDAPPGQGTVTNPASSSLRPQSSVASLALSMSWLTPWSTGSTAPSQASHAPQSQPAAAIDVERLNDNGAQEGHLARSVLQLALDRPGQTIELELSLGPRASTSRQPADMRPDRTLRLCYQPDSGIELSTSAPSMGVMQFGIRAQDVLSRQVDAVAGVLDDMSSLGRFTVLRVHVDPPPASTGLSGPREANPPLTEQEQSLIGVARWPDPAHNNERDPQQQAYGRSFRSVTQDAGKQLAQGHIRSLRELWTYAQDWRGRQVSGRDSKEFGLGSQRREDMLTISDMTPLTGKYRYIRDKYNQRTDGSLVYPERTSKRYSIHDTIDGKRIALSSVIIRTEWDAASARKFLDSRHGGNWPDDGPPPFHIKHTSVANARLIMDHAESLFSRALDPSASHSEALATLGELHWWLAHAMPDVRGSAAKAELCVRSLAQARGMDLPPFKQGVVPDLEAMTRSREDFVGGYAKSFSRELDFGGGASQGVQ